MTDQPTDRPTDKAGCRVACTGQKRSYSNSLSDYSETTLKMPQLTDLFAGLINVTPRILHAISHIGRIITLVYAFREGSPDPVP